MSLTEKPAMPIKIVFCYAHEDEELLNKLKAQLKPFQRQGIIDAWHDRNISAGMQWEREINTHLNDAHIILLLVSPDFIDSEYCYGTEMKRAVERHESGEACVIPIILRHVNWQDTPLGKLQALPRDAKPVKSWQDIDEAFLNVVNGISEVIKEQTTESSINIPIKGTITNSNFTNFVSRSNLEEITQIHLPQQRLASQTVVSSQSANFASSLDNEELEQTEDQLRSITFKQVIFVVAILDLVLLFISFFFPINTIISQIAIVLAVVIYICGLIPNFLLKPWYWFTSILLTSPLISGIYNVIDSQLNPTNSVVRWFGSIGFLMVSPIVVAIYSLFGPTKTPRHLIADDFIKKMTLTISLLGLALVVVGIGIQWTISIGLELLLASSFLAVVQLIRLKQGNWLVALGSSLFFFFPVLFWGIVYGAFGPADSKDEWEFPT